METYGDLSSSMYSLCKASILRWLLWAMLRARRGRRSLGSSVSGVNHGGEFRSSVDPSQLATPFASQSCKV